MLAGEWENLHMVQIYCLKTIQKNVFKLASELDQFNKERQILEKEVLDRILNNIQINLSDPVLILSGKNWHEGVIGIVAARIKDKFNKPTIIISIEGNIGKASARSIVGFDIGSIIIAATQQKLLIKGGGHKMAAGFSINIENIEKFKEFIFKKFKNIDGKINKGKILSLDSVIAPTALNVDFFKKVNLLGSVWLRKSRAKVCN